MCLAADIASLPIAGTKVVFLIPPEVGSPALIHDAAEIGTVHHAGNHSHFTHLCWTSACLPCDLTASAIASVQIGSCVFSKTAHSLSGFWMTFFLLLQDFFHVLKLTVCPRYFLRRSMISAVVEGSQTYGLPCLVIPIFRHLLAQ